MPFHMSDLDYWELCNHTGSLDSALFLHILLFMEVS